MHFDSFCIILWYFDIFCVCSIIFIISFEHLWTVFFAFFCNFMQLLFFGQDKWEQSINKISTEICFNEGFYVSMLSDVFLCSGGRGVCWDWGTWRSSSLPAFLFSSMDETVTWNEWLEVIKRGRKLAQNETLWNNMKHNESPKINQNQTPTKKYKINIKESKRYKKNEKDISISQQEASLHSGSRIGDHSWWKSLHISSILGPRRLVAGCRGWM